MNKKKKWKRVKAWRYPGLLVVAGIILAISIIAATLVQEEEVLGSRETKPL